MRCLTILMLFPISVTEPSHNIKLLRVSGEETFCSRKLCVRTPPLPLDWTYTGLTHAGSTNATLDNAGKGLIIMCPMINMRIECVVVSVLRVRIKSKNPRKKYFIYFIYTGWPLLALGYFSYVPCRDFVI